MNAAPVDAFYNEYPELAKVRDAIRSPFDAAFPNPGVRFEDSTITIPVPRLEIRRESLSPFYPVAAAVTHDRPAPAPMVPNHGVVPVLPCYRFHPLHLPHYASLPVSAGEPATKRRRVGEENEWMPGRSSQPFASTAPSLKRLLRANEELLVYAKLMGLEGKEGEGFVRKILNKYNVFSSVQERLDFAKKMFFHLSIALTSFERGEAQVTEAQVRKLSIEVLNFAKTMFRHMGTNDNQFGEQIREVILDTFNQHSSLTRFAKDGLSFTTARDYHFLGGKIKFTFMCWCAEQGISLDPPELQIFKALRCHNAHLNCPLLLEEIREEARGKQ